mmetsp:Transcript_29854/g.93284  ORF Transcript_29854/g.93284 Transcript_29854/m.93284 type:complete len:361 (+) Transcript_29854:1651-2733(+)
MLLRLLVGRVAPLGRQLERRVDVRVLLEGHAQRRQHCLGGKQLQLFLAQVLLGSLDEHQILEAGEGVEEVVVALPEDLTQVLVVHGPQVGLRAALAHELEDLRGRQVGLAPQVELGGDLQLPAAGLERPVDGLWSAGIDLVCRHLPRGVLAQLLVVLAEHLAEPLELLRALILAAEVEGVARGLVVHLLEAHVGLEHVQDNLVGLPEEAEVRVRVAVLALLSRVLRLDGPQQDGLRRLHLVQVRQLSHLQVLLLFGLVHLLLRGLPEVLHDLLQRLDAGRLAHGPVLVETLPGSAHLLELHAELEVLHHDALARGGPLVPELPVLDRGMQSVKAILLSPDVDQLLGSVERILRLLEGGHH